MRKTVLAWMMMASVGLWGCSIKGESGTVTEAALKHREESNLTAASLLYGDRGDLGIGYLVYTISDKKNEDYKLYFFTSERNLKAFGKSDICLDEADYIFPDVRESNRAIGEFSDICFYDMTDLTGDGRPELLVIARYEKDGRRSRILYMSRIYRYEKSAGKSIKALLLIFWRSIQRICRL